MNTNVPELVFKQAVADHEQRVFAHLSSQEAARRFDRPRRLLRARLARRLRALADRLEPVSAGARRVQPLT